jgi:dihydroorotate dehydrogenase electron transfer subunit
LYVEKTFVHSVEQITNNTYLIKVFAPAIACAVKPGQFCNVKVSEGNYPLLRRPFSICDTEGDYIFFLFDIHGEGTKILSSKKNGDELDILGPLGNGFNLDGDYKNAVIVAGGLGSAPFPYLIKNLPEEKEVFCFVGGRTKKHLVSHQLKNIKFATDDGSMGFHGNVVELLKSEINSISDFRIFSCGPNPMLKALQAYCIENKFDCQISVECAMACGFGICQGCPIDSYDGSHFKLVCKDGPVFNADEVRL